MSTAIGEDITPDKDGGILKLITCEGTGSDTPVKGDKVEVHYTGRLLDGTVFDSSVDRGDKFQFDLGMGSVIKGWDLGVATMKKGEKATFTLASNYAYGASGSPPKIPPDATLIFDIELFSWKMEDLTKKKTGDVYRRIITEGTGIDRPNEGSSVTVDLVGQIDDRVFEERTVTFTLGEASEQNVISGVELAVGKMKKGESSNIIISREFAWGPNPPEDFNLDPTYEKVTYRVTLTDFVKNKEVWELSDPERVEQAEICKRSGTKYFKEGKYPIALKHYKRATQMTGSVTDLKPNDTQKKEILLAAHLNLAMTYLKMEKPLEAIANATSALQIDGGNVKGLFRRGTAHYHIKAFEKAQEDFERCIQLDPTNSAAKVELGRTIAAIQQHRLKEKSMYKGMFEKFAKEDNKPEKLNQVWSELNDEGKREFKMEDTLEQELKDMDEGVTILK